MIRTYYAMVFCIAAVLLFGCKADNNRLKPNIEGIKLSDLAPRTTTGGPDERSLKTINFDIYVIDMPADSIDVLDNVWQELAITPLRFRDTDAFGANGFSVGFGQMAIWDKITDFLRAGGGKKTEIISLLLSGGQADDVVFAKLLRKQDVYYLLSKGPLKSVNVGPGNVGLRIKAKRIPGSRGICSVSFEPAFVPRQRSFLPQLAAIEKRGEFIFSPVGFGLDMAPGDFILLAPNKQISNRVSLGGLFFNKGKREPIIRTYLILCTRIVD